MPAYDPSFAQESQVSIIKGPSLKKSIARHLFNNYLTFMRDDRNTNIYSQKKKKKNSSIQ